MTKNKLYEGMFLIDSALAASNWDDINNAIKTILEKAGAEIVSTRKWDDRKLAYEIKGKSRGTYILCYFRVAGDKIAEIEKAVRLSEQIMRVLILSAEKMTTEDIEKETPATKAEKQIHEGLDETNMDDNETSEQNIDRDSEQEEAEPYDETEQMENEEQEPEEISENAQDAEPRE
ncbi:MAG: 30S ribosomal protein S6 [Sedimentisphaerales bacterium]|nr:30S ribosomal protein S6 [Sedimentisphaerales bacterium]